MCVVPSAPASFRVRVWHITSRGWDPWTERPLPEVVRVAYPLRKAGRRVFVMVSFFEDPAESLGNMDTARQAITQEMASLHPDVEVAVLFSLAPRG